MTDEDTKGHSLDDAHHLTVSPVGTASNAHEPQFSLTPSRWQSTEHACAHSADLLQWKPICIAQFLLHKCSVKVQLTQAKPARVQDCIACDPSPLMESRFHYRSLSALLRCRLHDLAARTTSLFQSNTLNEKEE